MADAYVAPQGADLTICDREPIHTPSAILPHGAMLVLDPASMTIEQAAGDTAGLLGAPIGDLLGRPAASLLRPDQADNLMALAAAHDLTKPRHLLDPLLRVMPDQPLDASLHRADGSLVLEFESADIADRFAADPLAGVHEMVEGMEAAVTLQALCQFAAERVRGVAGYDRVLVYRFMQDESGWVIAESREPNLAPFLNLHYPAADIPRQARALYLKNWLRLITQVDYQPAPLTPAINPRTGKPLDMSHAILRDVSPVHREYLRNMGVDASMSISIIRGGKLWGLIACHHSRPRLLPRHLRAICELFGSMFSLHLEAREQGEQFQERLASRMVLQNLMLNLAAADDYAIGLTQQSPNLLDYIHGGDPARDSAGQRGGVAVIVKAQLTYLGATPDEPQIKRLVTWLNDAMADCEGGVFSTDRLGELWPPAAAFAEVASGALVISVSEAASDFIIWFRPELVGVSSWAGEPKKLMLGGILSPRKSFEVWKETVRGRCLPWSTADEQAAFDLRTSLLHVVLGRITAAANQRKQAAERDQLMMAELDHRVKNTIANIQALVGQTSRSASTLTGFVQGLEGRIQSMAKAHSLLSQSRWEGVSMEKLLEEELNPYASGNSGVVLSGTDMLLTPKSALALSLAIHELATNAAKFGALSRPGGSIRVSWYPASDGSIELSWNETGGPLVDTPTHRGFGSTLIERALAMETGGRVNVHYLRSGVVCEISLPASSVAHTASAGAKSTLALSMTSDAAVRPDQQGFRILIVEDSFLLLADLETVFDILGWTVVGTASRKAEALAMVASKSFDAALLDVNLDGEMSWDVAALLKEKGIPFVFSTGYDVSRILPQQFAGSAILGKPFNINELESSLRKVISAGSPRQAPAQPREA
jgi:light-regulated signal transduction histidine kinase (bacteriophytochrome)/ActR/RegA family two-component response regulator